MKNPPTLLSGQFSPVTAEKGIMKKNILLDMLLSKNILLQKCL